MRVQGLEVLMGRQVPSAARSEITGRSDLLPWWLNIH